jgi:hypothetical protein
LGFFLHIYTSNLWMIQHRFFLHHTSLFLRLTLIPDEDFFPASSPIKPILSLYIIW